MRQLKRKKLSVGDIPLIGHTQINDEGDISNSEQSLVHHFHFPVLTFPYFAHALLKLAQKPVGFAGITGMLPIICCMISSILCVNERFGENRGNSSFLFQRASRIYFAREVMNTLARVAAKAPAMSRSFAAASNQKYYILMCKFFSSPLDPSDD